MCVNDDQVKLLLETVQMSVSSCMQHPELPTLRPQMVGRLMAAHHSSRVAVGPSRYMRLQAGRVRCGYKIVCCPDFLDHDVVHSCTVFACVRSGVSGKLTRLVGEVQRKLEMLYYSTLHCSSLGSLVLGNIELFCVTLPGKIWECTNTLCLDHVNTIMYLPPVSSA